MYPDVLNVILDAAAEASRDLSDWSADSWENDDKNEQWVQSYAAIRLNDMARSHHDDVSAIGDVYVTIESKVSWLALHCGASAKRGRPSLTGGQRFDVAVWNGQFVEGLLEIKNAPRANDAYFADDLWKLERALDRWGPSHNGSLRWGVFLFSVIGRGDRTTDNRERIRREAERRFSLCEVDAPYELQTGYRLVADSQDCVLGWAAVLISRKT